MTTVENKMPSVSGLVKKTDCSTKINEIESKITNHNHDKYITTPEFNKLTTENFKAGLKQSDLVKKDRSNCKALVKKLLKIKHSICWLKMN